MKNKKAEILYEQVIFIVLNIIFFSVMILFIYLQGSGVHLHEEKTAKQIALIIDSSKPGTEIKLNLEDFFSKKEKQISKESSVVVDNNRNLIVVKGSKDSFYEYSYFNNVDVEYNFEGNYLILVVK